MPGLVENPEERFSHDTAHSQKVVNQCVTKIQSMGKARFSSRAVHSAVIIKGRENAIFVGFFFTRWCRRKTVCVLKYYNGNDYFLTGHRVINFKMLNTPFCKFYCLLFTHR